MIQGLKMNYSERFFEVNKYGEIVNANGVVVDLTRFSTPAEKIKDSENLELEKEHLEKDFKAKGKRKK